MAMPKITHLKGKLLCTVLYLAFAATVYFFRIPCLFLHTLHVPCPGCGMTRAWLSALQLDFGAAFRYHPLFLTVIPLYLYILFDGVLFRNRILNRTVLILLIAGFFILEILRLAVNSL